MNMLCSRVHREAIHSGAISTGVYCCDLTECVDMPTKCEFESIFLISQESNLHPPHHHHYYTMGWGALSLTDASMLGKKKQKTLKHSLKNRLDSKYASCQMMVKTFFWEKKKFCLNSCSESGREWIWTVLFHFSAECPKDHSAIESFFIPCLTWFQIAETEQRFKHGFFQHWVNSKTTWHPHLLLNFAIPALKTFSPINF